MRFQGRTASGVLAALSLGIGTLGCMTGDSGQEKAGESVAERQETGGDAAQVADHGKPFYRAAGTGPAYWGPGDLYTFLATGDETGNAYFQFEALVPNGGGPPPHIHHAEDETFYLAKGSLEMHMGDEVISAKAGDFVNIPRGTVHSFKNVGAETATMIITFVPAGMEKYLEEVFPPAEDRTATPPPITEGLIQKMTAAAQKHNLEFATPRQAGEGH